MPKEPMRVDMSDLQDGSFAVLRPTVPWGLMRRASQYGDKNWGDFLDLAIKLLVVEWSVRDDEDNPLGVPRELPDGGLEDVDARIVARIATAVNGLLEQASPDPNSRSASSTS